MEDCATICEAKHRCDSGPLGPQCTCHGLGRADADVSGQLKRLKQVCLSFLPVE